MQLHNFRDAAKNKTVGQSVRIVTTNKTSSNTSTNSSSGSRSDGSGKDRKWLIGQDLQRCACARNGILTKEVYRKEGKYTLVDVRNHYGSFKSACIYLKIINPDNIEDRDMVIANIKNVLEYEQKIDEATYREFGAYSFDAIDKRYGFKRLLVSEGLLPVTAIYPKYTIRKQPRCMRLTWVYTHPKHIYGYERKKV